MTGGIEMVRARARGDRRAGNALRGVDAALDERQRRRPVEPHAALRRVHRFGDAEAQREQVAAVGERRVPVERDADPGIDARERIGDDVRRRVRDAIERRPCALGLPRRRRAHGVGRERAVGEGELECRH